MRRLAAIAAMSLIATATACGVGSSAGSGVYTTVDGAKQIDATAPINPFNPQGNTFLGYDAMTLAWPKNDPVDRNRFYPGLAASWSATPDQGEVVIHLQPDAKWSDGKPVTSEDVRTSIGLAYTQGGTAYAVDPKAAGSAADVRVVDAKTLKVTQGASKSNLFLRNVLSTVVVPAHVFGKLLPPGFWTTLKTARGTGPEAEKAKAQVTGLAQKVISFAPAEDVSAGPFVLERVNPGEALLVRNKHFFASRNIAPERVKVLNYTGNQQIWNYLIAGTLDSAPFTATPSGVLNRIRQTDGNEVVKGFSPVAVSLAFNQTRKPYDNVHVRRALAYLINRAQVTKVASPEAGTPAQTTTGIHAASAKSWLGGDGMAGLDPYRVDPAKAAKELEAAGMTKKDGRWLKPDGTPWRVEIHVPASFSDWVAAAKAITSQLNDYGVDAAVLTAADYTLYLDELAAGNYDIGFWLMALGPSPYNIYQRIYGSANGWQLLAGRLTRVPPGTQGNWMGGPETVGGVNPGALTNRLNVAGPDEQRRIVGTLAKLTNEQLPVIQLYDYVNTQFVSTTRYTGWPRTDSDVLRLPAGVWMQLGMIKKAGR
ncbi:peptide ABC transporter substrate-binding protein [Acrocarpospora phusangensis]|uniref:Peptide ABC transporter substrate-binding protein n=1 Tax=Acrocarpospora phusangensis TaxID=1070424 RepID=A0A919Q9V5_9ACTN|nr:ABC transporter substrate-binding protein [Acrocarpospora phusangensis]GIH25012.1 peptide ABC transporter substrate-binding protein [Acrocarpospora phusangensis]